MLYFNPLLYFLVLFLPPTSFTSIFPTSYCSSSTNVASVTYPSPSGIILKTCDGPSIGALHVFLCIYSLYMMKIKYKILY